MKGLIIVGLKNLHITPLNLILVTLAGLVFGAVITNSAISTPFTSGILSLFAFVYSIVYSQEHSFNWRRLEFIMPLAASKKILSRYILYCILFLAYMCFYSAFALANFFSGVELSWFSFFDSLMFYLGFFQLLGLFTLPLVEWLPVGKVGFAYPIGMTLGIIVLMSIIGLRLLFEARFGCVGEHFFLIFALITSILYVCSYFMCIRFYKRKSFE